MDKMTDCLTLFTARLYSGALSVFRRKEGQTLVEYALLLMLIAVVIIAAVAIIGQKTCNTYSNIASTFPNS